MSVDPSHFLATSNGGKPPLLKLQNISAKPELNGQFGQAVRDDADIIFPPANTNNVWNELSILTHRLNNHNVYTRPSTHETTPTNVSSFSAGRYVVAVLTAEVAATNAEPSYLKLKPENLVEASNFEQLKFGAEVAIQHVKLLMKSPYAQEKGSYLMSLMPPSIQAILTPEKAIIAAAIVMLLNIMLVFKILSGWINFTKIFTFLSLIGLLLAISSSDWMEGLKAGKPLKLIARSAALNAPTRFKQMLIDMTGYRNITDKMALGFLVAMLLWSGKILVTPTARPTRLQPPTPSNAGMQQRDHRLPQYDLENIYKMGWDDAQAGKDFGTSLPKDMQEDDALKPNGVDASSFDWAYDPPPPPPKQKMSSFGMGTMLSIFTLYRFGKDIVVTPDGQLMLDPNYIMMRLRNIEPWRLGLMGMSLYRVINAFVGR